MKSFASYHPVTLLIYFFIVLMITMFMNHPVLIVLSFAGALGYHFICETEKRRDSLLLYLCIFMVIALANPIFVHRGSSVLFFLNGKAITLEALVYGCNMAIMMLGVIFWCKIFSGIMTSDKLLYLCGRLAPNLSIVLSMTLRYVPLFQVQSQKVRKSQTALGLYTEDNYMTKVKGGLRIFSVVLTWSLENAIDTSNSMRARGYGLGKRSQFSLFRMTGTDLCLILLSLMFSGIIIIGNLAGTLSFPFYPRLGKVSVNVDAIGCYIVCGLLMFLPVFVELKEKLRWRLYRSRI